MIYTVVIIICRCYYNCLSVNVYTIFLTNNNIIITSIPLNNKVYTLAHQSVLTVLSIAFMWSKCKPHTLIQL